MTKQRVVLAVPGDLTMLTGGYIYDRRLLHELHLLGHDATHIELPASFPNPTPSDMLETFERLNDIDKHTALIVDGLAFGALEQTRVETIQAPVVALVHHPLAKENGISESRRLTLLNTERANLSHAKHILVPSPHTAATLVSEYAIPESRITIARPGTDRPIAPPQPIDPPLILSVGIQLKRKGHDILLKALAHIVDLDWQATIVGSPLDQNYSRELQRLLVDLGLTGRVKLAGKVDHETLAALYQSASLFALATRYEGYGIVFDEALVHSLPIVSCLTGAVSDTVPSSAGVLVPPEQPIAFAAALRNILTNPQTKNTLSAAANKYGQALPSWAETARTTAEALSLIRPPNETPRPCND